MTDLRLHRLGLAVGLVLCLFASSASACACRHHQKAEALPQEPSCHAHAKKKSQQKTADASLDDSPCICFDNSSKLSAKSGSTKLKNQPAIATVAMADVAFDTGISDKALSEYAKPFFLSDSFYNISPGRAPPFQKA